ncbi:hypothetical protein SAMN04489712_112240 [Thermomonospora echinospora]|uniref:Glycosyltransferase family 29 (Sialyltransferase) n=1 Tax=Thermomonospora echinospora TaxID=1992 RepID=A0A1H6D2I9_9ACTN|nr:hypothetical protein [Thermomonospora echinospora]SEG79579.1 hypothetical protein SAMN04489712_112240 [Thermomonospora echinospora]
MSTIAPGLAGTTVTAAGTTGTRATLRLLLESYARSAPPRSIAVVGNAPLSPDEVRAATIDSADLVLRMTTFGLDAPGGPPTVGRRCDVVVLHRGITPSPFTFADYTGRLYLLFEQGRPFGERQPLRPWWPADLGVVPVSNYEFTRPLNDLLGLDSRERVWATAGTLATFLCTELFPAATTYLTGVSLIDEPDQTTFEHHWGDAVRVTPEHRLRTESALLKQWIADGRIRFLP